MKRRTKLGLGVIGMLLAAGALLTVLRSNGNADKNKENTVQVTRGDLVDKALAVGTIVPLVEISVKSKTSGVVGARYAGPGDYVRAGMPLLEIRPNPTPLERVEAKRQLEMEEIRLANLNEEIARAKALHERGLLSTQEYEAKTRSHSESALQVQIAKERLALLEQGRVKIAESTIETVVDSPIDGFVLETMVEIGDPVVALSSYQEGTVLMTMADMRDLIFRGTVDEIDVGRLQEGMPAEIKVGAIPQAKVTGELSKISLKAKKEENATVFPVEIRLSDIGDNVLRAGYSANADIVIDRRDSVLTIPERVVIWSGDSTRVTVQKPDGTTEERTIRCGLSDAIQIEVQDGLAEGETVQEKPVKEIK